MSLVVLASRSEARLRLLRAAGVEAQPMPALVDEAALRETLWGERVDVEDAAVALAELKAAFVAGRAAPGAVVLGADQLLEVEGDWLEKPSTFDAARRQLERLRGRPHRLVSAAVAFRDGARVWHHVDTARLWVRACSDSFVERYLTAAGPGILGCVGAYQLEGLGAQLMARVDGDHFTIQGLPLLPILQFLRDQGVLQR